MKLEILLEKPDKKILIILFLSTFTLSLIFVLIIFPLLLSSFAPTGYSLNEFKFAWTKERMDKIIDAWMDYDSTLIDLMIIVHIWDFVFMAAYGTALASAFIIIARGLENLKRLQKFYLFAFILPWIAVILDVIEGIFILVMLMNPTNINTFNIFSAALSTTICITIFYFCLFLMIVGFIIVIILFIKDRNAR